MPNVSLSSKHLTLRPKTDADTVFLRNAYELSRDEETSAIDWRSDEERRVFFDQQFEAQNAHFESSYETLDYDIIEYDRKPIGRLVLSWEADHLHCVDLLLLPTFRKQRIGSAIMDAICTALDERDMPASLFYELWKPYLEGLYNRYGFFTTKTYAAHAYMQRKRKSAQPKTDS